MAKYTVILTVEGTRLPTIQKEAEAAFKGNIISIRKAELSTARAGRLDDIASAVGTLANDVEELRDELQEWYDNLPENFQNGDKGSELQEAIDGLEQIKDELEGVDFNSVNFPSMMG